MSGLAHFADSSRTSSRGPRSAKLGLRPRGLGRAISRNGIYGMSADDDGLFRLDVEGPDDVAPLLRFVGDELAEVRGRAHKRCAAQVSKPRFRLGVGEY